MTDYNDGKWHGWNGGECPVHRRSEVECSYTDRKSITSSAGSFPWDATNVDRPAAFRVIKQHREPREFWIWTDSSGKQHAVDYNAPGAVKFREVLE